MIMSTGMATLAEIDDAVQSAKESGASQIALLKCNNAYPAPPEEMNLRIIPHLADASQLPNCLIKNLTMRNNVASKKMLPYGGNSYPPEGAYDESTQQARIVRSRSTTVSQGQKARESTDIRRVCSSDLLPSEIRHPVAQARGSSTRAEKGSASESISRRGG